MGGHVQQLCEMLDVAFLVPLLQNFFFKTNMKICTKINIEWYDTKER